MADGVRSPLGKLLGREWHRDTVYAVAGRAYVDSEMSDDPWISSHLELRDEQGELLSGYGWIFPLGNGAGEPRRRHAGDGQRPAEVAIKPLMQTYADTIRDDFELSGDLRTPTSALLPMGGAVSNVAGPNWALIGDAAACVNPLNGEGIDYGLETGRLVAEHIAAAAASARPGARRWSSTTARRSPSPVAWPGSRRSRRSSAPSARPGCAPTG